MRYHVRLIHRSRIAAWVLALALPAAACGGGGPSAAELDAVSQMLERLGRSPAVAECMAGELGEDYAADDFQPLIDGRGDYTGVDFKLLEDMVVAERACTDD